MTPTRLPTITQKVATSFGTLYVHVNYAEGRPVALRISSPGKFSDTTMGAVLDAIAEAATDILGENHDR